LERRDRVLICSRGHSFDIARSGYCNLLQPQDRRSRRPGDSRETAAARRRFLAGCGEPLLRAILQEIRALAQARDTAILDVGCGEGFHLGGIAREAAVEAHGLDLSAAAIELAARRYPAATWVVANADRFLPYAEGSFGLILSVDARLNPAEMRRVLASEGRLLVALPGPDDLVELRAAVLGEGTLRGRLERTAASLSSHFEIEALRTVRQTSRLDPDAIRDALAATYRGGRESRRLRIEALGEMEVTLSHDIARFKGKISPS